MKQLPYTEENVSIIQDFLDETKKRISDGSKLFSQKKLDLNWKI